MSEESEWDSRYGSKSNFTDELKPYLKVRLFGPYAGDSADILEDICRKLSEEENYNAEICSKLSVKRSIREDHQEGEPVYNFKNSLECISEADVCIFLFMDARKSRFDVLKAEDHDEHPDLKENRCYPQDLNSSVVLEFQEWCKGPSSIQDGFVVYEKFGGKKIGSLIRGCIEEYRIFSQKVSTQDTDTVEELSDTIAGQCRHWFDEYSEKLIERKKKIESS